MSQSSVSLVDLFLISPAIALFVLSLLPLTVKVLRKNVEPSKTLVLSMGIFAILIAFVLNTISYNHIIIDQNFIMGFSDSLIFNKNSYLVISLVLLFSVPALVLCSFNNLIRSNQFSEFTFLMLSSILGMFVLSWANDLILLFIGIELMSLPLYIMVLMTLERKVSKEAALKYFILGSVASAFLLLGMAFMYGSTVSNHGYQVVTKLHKITEVSEALLSGDRLFFIGSICMLLAMAFKIALFPFHSWSPDVYEGSNTSLTYYMIVPVKIASIFAFAKILQAGMLTHSLILQDIFQWLAVLTMLVGSFGALLQTSVKRILAYSSISHSGYLMMGLLAYSFKGTNSDLSAIGFYLLGYGVLTALSFAFLVYFENKKGGQILLDDLNGLGFKAPLLSLGMLAGILGVAGIPPFVGFFGKVFVFKEAIDVGLYWVVFWGLLNSVIAAFYYIKIVVHLYLKEENSFLKLWDDSEFESLSMGFPAKMIIIFGLVLALFSPIAFAF